VSGTSAPAGQQRAVEQRSVAREAQELVRVAHHAAVLERERDVTGGVHREVVDELVGLGGVVGGIRPEARDVLGGGAQRLDDEAATVLAVCGARGLEAMHPIGRDAQRERAEVGALRGVRCALRLVRW
jgi:hypothetical protein